jgi:hypothetical protein
MPGRRSPVLLVGGLLVALLSGGFVVALLSEGRIEGSVPGGDPVLGLAAVPAGFLVGTASGAVASPDGRRWRETSLPGAPRGRVLVAAADGRAVAVAGGRLYEGDGLDDFRRRSLAPRDATALAAGGDGEILVATQGGRLVRVGGDATQDVPLGPGAPREILALAARDGGLYAGGLSSGLWQSVDGGRQWQQLLKTPIRAVLADGPVGAGRLLLATPGGILVSADDGRSWRFTELRIATEGLSASGGAFYALTSERVVYHSADGEGSWSPLVPTR